MIDRCRTNEKRRMSLLKGRFWNEQFFKRTDQVGGRGTDVLSTAAGLAVSRVEATQAYVRMGPVPGPQRSVNWLKSWFVMLREAPMNITTRVGDRFGIRSPKRWPNLAWISACHAFEVPEHGTILPVSRT